MLEDAPAPGVFKVMSFWALEAIKHRMIVSSPRAASTNFITFGSYLNSLCLSFVIWQIGILNNKTNVLVLL